MKNASVKHIEIDTHIQTVREDRLRALKHRPSYLRKSQKHQYVSCNPSPRPLWTWVPRIPCSHHFPVAMVTGRWVVFLPGPQLLQLLGVHVDLVHERPSPVIRPLPAVSVRWGVGPGVHCVLIGRRPRSGGRVLPRSNIIIWIFVLFIVMMFLVGTWIAAWIGVIISSERKRMSSEYFISSVFFFACAVYKFFSSSFFIAWKLSSLESNCSHIWLV